MSFLYQTGIFIYAISVKIASLFNEKARQFVSGRRNWRKKLAEKIETNARYIWVHCASLGEFEQGRPLIEEMSKQFPEYRVVLTFFSPSGYEIRKNYALADIVMYLPVDTQRNAKRFLRLVQPEKAFFIKYEYWHFYIDELKKSNNLKPTSYFQEMVTELLNLRLMFFVVLILLSVEWFLRKYWGIY